MHSARGRDRRRHGMTSPAVPRGRMTPGGGRVLGTMRAISANVERFLLPGVKSMTAPFCPVHRDSPAGVGGAGAVRTGFRIQDCHREVLVGCPRGPGVVADCHPEVLVVMHARSRRGSQSRTVTGKCWFRCRRGPAVVSYTRLSPGTVGDHSIGDHSRIPPRSTNIPGDRLRARAQSVGFGPFHQQFPVTDPDGRALGATRVGSGPFPPTVPGDRCGWARAGAIG
jgi:hypothetical protein